MCQFHWELDCVGFCPFEIWRCDCVEMMRGIGGEVFFSILGYRRGIARVSPEIPELFCLVLPCRSCCYCCYYCWFCWSCCCCCCCCCLPSHYRVACATRGTNSSRHWPGDRGGNSPACLRPTANARLVGYCLDCIRPCTCIFGWSLHFDWSCGETCVPLRFSTKSFKMT